MNLSVFPVFSAREALRRGCERGIAGEWAREGLGGGEGVAGEGWGVSLAITSHQDNMHGSIGTCHIEHAK